MATMTQDEHIVGVTVKFFDDHTPPRPAKIDVSDRQPSVIFNDPAIAIASNIVVAADGTSMTYDIESGLEGTTQGAYDVDVNLANGVDQSLVLAIGEDIVVTPGAPGPVSSAASTFPPATPKNP